MFIVLKKNLCENGDYVYLVLQRPRCSLWYCTTQTRSVNFRERTQATLQTTAGYMRHPCCVCKYSPVTRAEGGAANLMSLLLKMMTEIQYHDKLHHNTLTISVSVQGKRHFITNNITKLIGYSHITYSISSLFSVLIYFWRTLGPRQIIGIPKILNNLK